MTYVLLLAGFALLVAGAEVLVRGAGRVAVRFGLSPIVVGLTVVAFGTSAPELAVSVGSAFSGQTGLAVGNVVGSNIANVLLVLGASAAFGGTLVVASKIVRVDVPLMIGASVTVLLMSLNGAIGRLEGALLFACILGYVTFTVMGARNASDAEKADFEAEYAADDGPGLGVDVLMIVGGVGALVLGSKWLVDSASEIAAQLGVSDLVIGLTVVALGTSAPELATSLIAAIKGERDIAVGNAVGSNLFNLLSVLGLTALVAPDGLPVSDDALRLDMPVMVAVAVACLPVFFNGYSLKRWEGGLFLAYYIAYITFLVLTETGSGLRDPFAVVMGVFVIPLTVITFAVVGWQAWRSPHNRSPSALER
ncbi:MAG: calcium/sodium antiporter [Microthrixaceae bacterium]